MSPCLSHSYVCFRVVVVPMKMTAVGVVLALWLCGHLLNTLIYGMCCRKLCHP